jgi:acetyl esterase/lipase
MIGRRGAIIGSLAALAGGCSPAAALLNATVPRTGYVLEADLAYGRLPRQRLDYYAPAAPQPGGKTVVFFYGGAWHQGDKADYLFLGQALASRGIGVVVADYRLYPDVRYPAFIQDGALAVGWSARRFGSERLFLMGHSAGAYIASMLAANTAYLRSAGVDRLKLGGLIGIAGPYDFRTLNYRWLRDIFGNTDDAAIQPVSHATAPLPPALLLHGTADRLVAPRNSQRLAAAWQAARSPVNLKLYDEVDHLTIVGAFADMLQGRAPTRADVLAWLGARRPIPSSD